MHKKTLKQAKSSESVFTLKHSGSRVYASLSIIISAAGSICCVLFIPLNFISLAVIFCFAVISLLLIKIQSKSVYTRLAFFAKVMAVIYFCLSLSALLISFAMHKLILIIFASI